MNSNFEYYKVFYYVAKYENLTKASSVLKTSQPAVTRTIHNLEKNWDVGYLPEANRHETDTGGKNLLQLCIGRVRPVF